MTDSDNTPGPDRDRDDTTEPDPEAETAPEDETEGGVEDSLFTEEELKQAGRTDPSDEDEDAASGRDPVGAASNWLASGVNSITNTMLAGGVVVGSTILGTRIFPKSEKLWLGVAKLGLKKTKKTTGADMIGFLPGEGSQLQPTPMKLKQRDEDDSEYWATVENDIEYEPGPQGVSREFIGNVPVGFFVEDPPREVSLLQARVRDAIDLGQHRPVVDGTVKLHEHVYQPADAMQGGESPGSAVADGGHTQAQATGQGQAGLEKVFDREVGVVDADEIPKDGVIDLSTDGGNGARVSWNRVTDIFQDTPATEKMVMQEQRGELAGAAGNDEKIQRIALYAILGIVATVFIFYLGPSIVNAVFGGGTFGGVGGALPSVGG